MQDIKDGSFQSVVNLAIWSDLELCYNDTLVLFWDGYESFVHGMSGNVSQSIDKALLLIHEAPVAYTDCQLLLEDIKHLDNIFNAYDNVESPDMYFFLAENLMFNTADILVKLGQSRESLKNHDYYGFGTDVGHVISDIFFKNPLDFTVWSVIHSDIIID